MFPVPGFIVFFFFFFQFVCIMCIMFVVALIVGLQMLETDKNMNNTRGNEFNVFHSHHPFCAFHKSTIYKFTFRIKQSVMREALLLFFFCCCYFNCIYSRFVRLHVVRTKWPTRKPVLIVRRLLSPLME